MSQKKKVFALFASIIFIDQLVKFYIKSTMTIGQEYPVFGNWFIIHFIENNGMAYGLELGGQIGKIMLTTFRLLAVSLLGWYIFYLIKKGINTGVILGLTAIAAGASGNIIDSLFYGIMFGESTFTQVAQFLPSDGGYAPMLFGKVVDMLYFPLIDTTLPSWIPIWGGDPFVFFQPVFNIADSAVTVGVAYMLLFERGFIKKQ